MPARPTPITVEADPVAGAAQSAHAGLSELVHGLPNASPLQALRRNAGDTAWEGFDPATQDELNTEKARLDAVESNGGPLKLAPPTEQVVQSGSSGRWMFSRTLPNTLTSFYANAAVIFEQTRGGTDAGDPLFVVREHSQAEAMLRRERFYLTDYGGLYTGREIVCSEKRIPFDVNDLSKGSRIVGPSALADGSEGFMIGASPDLDGPTFAAEAKTANTAGQKNQAAFAAYNLSEIIGGSGPYMSGYGKKRFAIRGNGDLIWGADLSNDLWANGDAILQFVSPGIMALGPWQKVSEAKLSIRAPASQQASIALVARGGADANGLVLTQSSSQAGIGSLTLDTMPVVRFYSRLAGVNQSGGAIAVGGVDDATAIGTFAVASTANSAMKVLVARGRSGGTGSLFEAQDSASAILSKFDKNGYFMTRKTAAPADADLANGEGAIWWDPTPTTGGFRYKGKDSAGAILSGTL